MSHSATLFRPRATASITVTDDTGDYAKVKRAIEFISGYWREHPPLEEIAHAIGVTSGELHTLFRRWSGMTPKTFIQALTLDYTRGLLRDGASVLDATYAAGLSGPGRLHDLFVTHEAMSPGDFKTGGAGLALRYGFHPSPFGEAIVVAAPRGLAALGWVDDKTTPGAASGTGKSSGGRLGALADMQRRWPQAKLIEATSETEPFARRAFDPAMWRLEQPLRVVLIGSDFEISVWETLLKIPFGTMQSYSHVAGRIGQPKAARAVGAAVGRNPISFVVPCHRVAGKNGSLTGYHWGLTRKRAILGWEAGYSGHSI